MLPFVIYLDLQNLVFFPSHQHVEKPGFCKVYPGETQSFLVNHFNHWSIAKLQWSSPRTWTHKRCFSHSKSTPWSQSVSGKFGISSSMLLPNSGLSVWDVAALILMTRGLFSVAWWNSRNAGVASKNGSRNMFLPGKDKFFLTSRSLNKSFGPKFMINRRVVFSIVIELGWLFFFRE